MLSAATCWLILVSLYICIAQDVFSGCNRDEYYAEFDTNNLETISIDQLTARLERVHNVLPYTDADEDDVWKALADLDAGAEAETVRLIYSQQDVPILPRGTPDTWNREHVWPKSRGIGTSGADFTDIHHLRPADATVNTARSNLFFGECDESCTSPAHQEAAADTAKDSVEFAPPESARGDVARALFYMSARYTETNHPVGLRLTDCPKKEGDMAFLSDLLTWHLEDPVSTEEIARNSRACSRWQGNRNPFVDFPDLVPFLFGTPNVTTSCPSTESEPQTNKTLVAGDIMVVAVGTDNPDLVGLVSLVDIAAGTTLFITDNAWTGSSLQSNEGTIQLRVPQNIPNGTVFGYGDGLLYGDQWVTADAGFSLSTSGDAILIYTETETGDVVFLAGVSFSNGEWTTSPDGSTANSVLPESIRKVSVTLGQSDNLFYVGTRTGTRAELLEELTDPGNWNGVNDVNQRDLSTRAFTVKKSFGVALSPRLQVLFSITLASFLAFL